MGGKGLFWSLLPSPGRRCSPILPRRPGRALLQPKQGRSSNLRRVGSTGRSRVSLSRLPSLIIPRELVGAAEPHSCPTGSVACHARAPVRGAAQPLPSS